jgi:hypothetical protein
VSRTTDPQNLREPDNRDRQRVALKKGTPFSSSIPALGRLGCIDPTSDESARALYGGRFCPEPATRGGTSKPPSWVADRPSASIAAALAEASLDE